MPALLWFLATWACVAAQLEGNIAGPGQGLRVTEDVVPTTLSHEYALVAEITLGTPPQKMNCLLDSGSSDLWVPSMRCASCQRRNLFSTELSSSMTTELLNGNQTPTEVSIAYGSGEIVGFVVRDRIGFGAVEVEGQPFVVVEDARLPMARAWDGICGLGWEALAKIERPLYMRMQEQGLQAIFSFVPGRLGERPYLRVGEMAEEGRMKPGTLVWAEAETMGAQFGVQGRGRGFWLVSGGVAVRQKEPVPVRFLVDTGTNQVLLAPAQVYNRFMRSLLPDAAFESLCGTDDQQNNLVVCNCSIAQMGLPPLRVYLGGRPFVLDVRDLFRRVRPEGGAELCILQIQPNGMLPEKKGVLRVPDLLGGLLGGLLASSDVGDDGGASSNVEGALREGQSVDGLLESIFGPSMRGGERRKLGEAAEEDIWMIGGVFLEHFVTVFDFDRVRIGFAEPAEGVHALHPSSLSAAQALPSRVGPAALPWPQSFGSGRGYLALAACATSAAAVGAVLLGRLFKMWSVGETCRGNLERPELVSLQEEGSKEEI